MFALIFVFFNSLSNYFSLISYDPFHFFLISAIKSSLVQTLQLCLVNYCLRIFHNKNIGYFLILVHSSLMCCLNRVFLFILLTEFMELFSVLSLPSSGLYFSTDIIVRPTFTNHLRTESLKMNVISRIFIFFSFFFLANFLVIIFLIKNWSVRFSKLYYECNYHRIFYSYHLF